MNARHVYTGEYGQYEVPEPIVRLAEAANLAAGLPPISGLQRRRRFWLEPAFRVMDEWGKWRDSQERAR